jgi:hypothetical protein
MLEAWFRPKRYGYGAGLPIHWKGWAVIFSYLVLALLIAGPLPAFFPALDPRTVVVVGVAVLSVMFILVVKARTEGGWHWRWGGD